MVLDPDRIASTTATDPATAAPAITATSGHAMLRGFAGTGAVACGPTGAANGPEAAGCRSAGTGVTNGVAVAATGATNDAEAAGGGPSGGAGSAIPDEVIR
jgi:hypothetical protein